MTIMTNEILHHELYFKTKIKFVCAHDAFSEGGGLINFVLFQLNSFSKNIINSSCLNINKQLPKLPRQTTSIVNVV